MRSPRGFAAALIFLAALPLAALSQAVTSINPPIVFHVVLALGAALMALVFDLRTARWVAWTGWRRAATWRSFFVLHAVSEVAQKAPSCWSS